MRPKSYKLFAQLLEGHLLEASSAMSVAVANTAGAIEK
jgi:hypothetical protein